MSLKKYIAESAQAKQQPVTGDNVNFTVNGIKTIKSTVVEHAGNNIVLELTEAQLDELLPIIGAVGGALARGAATAGGALAKGAANAVVGTGVKSAANKLDKALFGPTVDNDEVATEAFDDEEEVEYMPKAGDVVQIDYPTEHEGQLGEVVEVAPSGSFAYVQFKDGDIESYHASNLVKVDDATADSYFDQDEQDDGFDESLGQVQRLAGMAKEDLSVSSVKLGDKVDTGNGQGRISKLDIGHIVGKDSVGVDTEHGTIRSTLNKLSKVNEAPAYDTSPGSPFDRGQADAYYGRRGNPTKVIDKVNPTVRGEREIVKLTDPEEIKAYYAGYEGAEFGEKDYGTFPDTSDDEVDEDVNLKEAPAQMGSYLGIKALKAPPLKNYRPAIWENMLGTVYAMNDAEQIEFFDYDRKAAMAYAGIGPDSAPRMYRIDKHAAGRPHGEYRYGGMYDYASPRHGKLVLFIKKNTAPVAELSEPKLDRYIAKRTRQGASNHLDSVELAHAKVNSKYGWRGKQAKIPASPDPRPKDTWEESINVYVKESKTGKLTKLTLSENIVRKDGQWTVKVWSKK